MKNKKILTRSADLYEFSHMLKHGYKATKCPICRWFSIELREYNVVRNRGYLNRFRVWLGSKKLGGGQ